MVNVCGDGPPEPLIGSTAGTPPTLPTVVETVNVCGAAPGPLNASEPGEISTEPGASVGPGPGGVEEPLLPPPPHAASENESAAAPRAESARCAIQRVA